MIFLELKLTMFLERDIHNNLWKIIVSGAITMGFVPSSVAHSKSNPSPVQDDYHSGPSSPTRRGIFHCQFQFCYAYKVIIVQMEFLRILNCYISLDLINLDFEYITMTMLDRSYMSFNADYCRMQIFNEWCYFLKFFRMEFNSKISIFNCVNQHSLVYGLKSFHSKKL